MKTVYAPAAIEARLITLDDLTENLGYEFQQISSYFNYAKTDNTPSWVYNSDYTYWTMTPYENSSSSVWGVERDGLPSNNGVSFNLSIRPVIVLPKSAID